MLTWVTLVVLVIIYVCHLTFPMPMISGDPGGALALCPLLTSLRILSTCVAWQVVPLRYGRKGWGQQMDCMCLLLLWVLAFFFPAFYVAVLAGFLELRLGV